MKKLLTLLVVFIGLTSNAQEQSLNVSGLYSFKGVSNEFVDVDFTVASLELEFNHTLDYGLILGFGAGVEFTELNFSKPDFIAFGTVGYNLADFFMVRVQMGTIAIDASNAFIYLNGDLLLTKNLYLTSGFTFNRITVYEESITFLGFRGGLRLNIKL